MRCFFCENIGSEGSFADLSEREEKHIFTILRGRTGDIVELLDGKGTFATARIEKDRKLTILSKGSHESPEKLVSLYVSSPKHNKIDQLLAQCSEIGIKRVTFIICEHSVVRPELNTVPERWHLHLEEGCKQAHNPFLPLLEPVVNFEDAIMNVQRQGIPSFYGSFSGQIVSSVKNESKEMAWFVGPEGGFTEKEEFLMKNAGWTALRIGKWTMRIETAAIAGAVLLMKD